MKPAQFCAALAPLVEGAPAHQRSLVRYADGYLRLTCSCGWVGTPTPMVPIPLDRHPRPSLADLSFTYRTQRRREFEAHLPRSVPTEPRDPIDLASDVGEVQTTAARIYRSLTDAWEDEEDPGEAARRVLPDLIEARDRLAALVAEIEAAR